MAKRKPLTPLTKETWKTWHGKPVAVFWEDACFHEDPGLDPVDPEVAISFGLIDEWDDRKLRLIGEFFPTGNGKRRVTGIPSGMVRMVVPWRGWSIPDEFVSIILKSMMGASLGK